MARLAEQAKQTAFAIEREKAARERAAELAKANEALRGCLDALQKLVERPNVPGWLRCNFLSTGIPEESLPPSVQKEGIRPV